jgi:hypothetical protein
MSRSVQLLWLATLLTVLFVASTSRSQAQSAPTAFRECTMAGVAWQPELIPVGIAVPKQAKGTTPVPEGWTPVGAAGASASNAVGMLICR